MPGHDDTPLRRSAVRGTRAVFARLAFLLTVGGLLIVAGLLGATPAPADAANMVLAPRVQPLPAPRLEPELTVTPSPTPGNCGCELDAYEPDDNRAQAKLLTVGAPPQSHNFHFNFDIDWFRLDSLKPGRTYTVSTFNLAAGADTYMVLYDRFGGQIDTSDDLSTPLCLTNIQYCASTITWTPAETGPYLISVRTLGHLGCPCASYQIRAQVAGSFLPIVFNQLTPTPVATPTFTPTPTLTATFTPSPTWTPSPTLTQAPTWTPSPTLTLTPTLTPSPTWTPTLTFTPSRTLTPSQTPTVDPSVTPSLTFTPSPTVTPSRTFTPSPTVTPSLTFTPSATPSPSQTPTPYTGTGYLFPQAVAVNSATQRLYVTSRDLDQVVMLDAATLAVMDRANAGDQPWGVAYHPGTNRVFVANFGSGTVTVLNGTTLDVLASIYAGPGLTVMEVVGDRVFTVSYFDSSLVVINAVTLSVEANPGAGLGAGSWGLAVNPVLNRAYVSNRNWNTIATFDGNAGWEQIGSQSKTTNISQACSPYEMAFNPANNKLYVACAVNGNVNRVLVYLASAGGLNALTEIPVGNGGSDAGGGVAINPATGTVFVSNAEENTVTIIDGVTNAVLGTAGVGANPFGIGVDPTTGRAYVANRLSDNVSVILDPKTAPVTATPTTGPTSTATGTPTRTPTALPPPPALSIPALGVPNGLAANRLTHQLFVTDRAKGQVYRVNLLTGVTQRTIPTGSLPFGVAVNSATNKIYVANYASNTVTVINGVNDAIIKQISLAPYGEPSYVAVDEGLNRIYVSLHNGGRLAVIDGFSDAVVASIEVGAGAFGVAVDPVLHRVYVSCRDQHLIRVVDGASDSIRWGDTLFTGGEPYALAVDETLRRLYAVYAPDNTNPNAVQIYRLEAGGPSLAATVPVGAGGTNGGGGIVANPNTGRVFVTNSAADTVTVFEGATGAVTGTIGVGDDPMPLTIDRVLGRVYVGNRGSASVLTLVDAP